jgi:UDP-galactopyranose mutase
MSKTGQIIVVGAGISGATLARKYAEIGKKVIVLEKRSHIGGNCFDYFDDAGILVSKYGAHLFHTNFEDVWSFVNRFSDWYSYEHKVLSNVDGQLVPIPVNITTVNKLFGLQINNETQMKQWLSQNTIYNPDPKNGEEAALSGIGPVLYDKLIKYYTFKQWNKWPSEMEASVAKRIPVRTNFDDRYFTDKYQYLPVGGYAPMFQKLLSHPNIRVLLNTDYFDVRDKLPNFEKIFYTGPIDRFFDFKYKVHRKLEYRSINFIFESLDREYYQLNSVINYPGLEVPYTRIVEYKHMTRQKHPKTTISKEISTDIGEPYYPVPTSQNTEVYEMYKKETEKLRNVYFVGRLASYKYFNMDQAFKNALDTFEEIQNKDKIHNFYIHR